MPAIPSQDLVIRLLPGSIPSSRHELVLSADRPHLPFSVGDHGDWRVKTGEPSLHAMFAFNGIDLYVGADGPGVLANGEELAHRWAVLPLPATIDVGSVRLELELRARVQSALPAFTFPGEPPEPEDAPVAAEMISPAACSVRRFQADAVTTIDDERLQAALRLSQDEARAIALARTEPTAKPTALRRPRIRPITSQQGSR
ncbi:MAG: hypothetical protein JWP97_3481 [Labilithrix sp.]|nr:hypothetical protein [Labilithrix sp.]